jgi:hypothetical protein
MILEKLHVFLRQEVFGHDEPSSIHHFDPLLTCDDGLQVHVLPVSLKPTVRTRFRLVGLFESECPTW